MPSVRASQDNEEIMRYIIVFEWCFIIYVRKQHEMQMYRLLSSSHRGKLRNNPMQ